MSSCDAVIATPIGRVGICVEGAQRVRTELRAYFSNPRHKFRIPLARNGTPYQRSVWRALARIPVGEVRSYGEIAHKLKSGPRALAPACRANPVPIVVPCHRVVAKSGLGGFMGHDASAALRMKRGLLAHERAV